MSEDAVFELDLDLDPAQVFRWVVEPALLRRWIPVTVFEPWVGGRVELEARGMVAIGRVTALDAPRLVSYSWDWRDSPLVSPTEVTIALSPRGPGTRLRLTHSGLSPDQRPGFAEGWNHYLPRLRAAAEDRVVGPDTFATPG